MYSFPEQTRQGSDSCWLCQASELPANTNIQPALIYKMTLMSPLEDDNQTGQRWVLFVFIVVQQ